MVTNVIMFPGTPTPPCLPACTPLPTGTGIAAIAAALDAVERYLTEVERRANALHEDATRVGRDLPCDADAFEAACAWHRRHIVPVYLEGWESAWVDAFYALMHAATTVGAHLAEWAPLATRALALEKRHGDLGERLLSIADALEGAAIKRRHM